MARLVSVEVLGLAGSKLRKKIQFRPDVTVLYGLNGSGKTSLLKIINSALTGDATALLRVPFESATIRLVQDGVEYVRSISKDVAVGNDEQLISLMNSYDFESMTSAERRRLRDDIQRRMRFKSRHSEAPWDWETDPGIDAPISPFTHRYLPTSRLTTGRSSAPFRRESVDASDVMTEASYDKFFAHSIQRIWEMYSRRELFEERQIQQAGLAAILSSIVDRQRIELDVDDEAVASADSAYRALTKFFQDQQLKVKLPQRQNFVKFYKKDPLLRNVVAEIAEVEKKVTEVQAPSRKISDLVSRLYSNGKSIRLEKSIIVAANDTDIIPIEYLSSGEKQLLLILLETLIARSDAIIIDEPELSMHVDWQLSIVDSMRTVNDEAQIVIATHSPEVLAGVPYECVQEL
ncbi:cytochrome c biogenesis protein CcmA [Mycobacteroides abscessus subsp. abscessus]|uniref:AAA family ATPase n=1 Tax=Mycobacteroides abscessus TaxID=36809 RepID=UPI00092779FF|nr:AAA family ATPase [Mycobacteroides abscessus]SHS43334.1 cytochrome c biogenesis protein CcmA [Mycobacteroides abscessus subsp. abscessus]SHS60656.1 cytochrome c biogenesis protein CcmA [Mycobacteroides abscessus subsp. abscessus]SHS90761.1 cytochrome c biogenesis protein CcmA [Mycobacteroides abscessus subsp. abscessus]SHU47432.1 cytochrome c biogenesis protein CcmA [Mycobacteroides abscessus subsp. abscessus]SHU85057.1 cytochrome c biogenesis protein CcmA [Mycobacteroides abscessus subsp. 